jgi:hypothetical protein
MERPSIWVIIVVLVLGVLFRREPRFQRSDQPATLSRRTVQDVIGSAGAPLADPLSENTKPAKRWRIAGFEESAVSN